MTDSPSPSADRRPQTKRRVAAIAAGTCAVVALAAIVVLFGGPPVVASTDAVTLKAHVYDMPVEQTRQVAGGVGATVLGWHVVQSDSASGTIHLQASARLGTAHDEITATVRPVGRNAAVDIVSQAGYRGMDFGANAQHVRDLQAAMDRQLPPAP